MRIRFLVITILSALGVAYSFTTAAQQKKTFAQSFVRMQLLKGHEGHVCAAAFSPDGRTLATMSDNEVRFWDAKTGELKKALNATGSCSYGSIVFSPDGKLLATPSGLVDVATGELRQKYWDVVWRSDVNYSNGEATQKYSYTPQKDRESVLIESLPDEPLPKKKEERTIKSGKVTMRLERAEEAILAFSPDGLFLFGRNSLLDVKTGEPLQTTIYYRRPYNRPYYTSLNLRYFRQPIAFFLANNLMGVGIEGGNIELSRINIEQRTKQVVYSLAGHKDSVIALAFSKNGRVLASGEANGALKLWDIEKGALLCTLSEKGDAVEKIAFLGNQALATGGTDGVVRLWRVCGEMPFSLNEPLEEYEGKHLIGLLGGHIGGIASIAFSPVSWTLATGGSDRTVRLRWKE